MSENRTLIPKRGDIVIHQAQGGEPYVCVGWVGPFVVLMSTKEPESMDKFWFENWENAEEKYFIVIALPDPVREAWTSILPKEVKLTPETALEL